MNTESAINRRSFIQRGAAAAAGGLVFAAGNGGNSAAQTRPSKRPYVTCRKGKKLVGVYCSADQVLNKPDYIDELQKKLGCNLVILQATGCSYPEEIRRLSPFPPEKNQWIGRGYSENDEEIHRCSEVIHARGMDVWLSGSGHMDNGHDDALSPVDFNGMLLRNHPKPKYGIEGGTGLCFQKPPVVRWQENAYPWISQNYDIDALYLSHHRYSCPAQYSHLFGCACEHCREAAARLGYNFPGMRSAMMKLLSSLRKLTKEQIRLAVELGFSFTDFIQFLCDGPDILDWFEFRAAAFTDTFGSVNRSIRLASGGNCKFIIDTLNPAFMLLVGHDFKGFVGGATDAFYPMAWIDYHYISVVASWANAFVELVDGLDEPTALGLAYNLAGWHDVDLPREKISGLGIGATSKEHSIPEFYKKFGKYVPGLMTHEYRRGALMNRSNCPSYQTVFPHFWGGKITEPLMDEIMAAGHDGYIFEISAEPFVKRPG